MNNVHHQGQSDHLGDYFEPLPYRVKFLDTNRPLSFGNVCDSPGHQLINNPEKRETN